MDDQQIKAEIKRVRDMVRVTKVVCTRSVKGRGGDSYVGFSAAWDSIQDDGGGAADLASASTDAEVQQANASGGLTLREARIAAYVLAMQADIAAHDHAMAGGNISPEQRESAVRALKANYNRLLTDLVGNGNGG